APYSQRCPHRSLRVARWTKPPAPAFARRLGPGHPIRRMVYSSARPIALEIAVICRFQREIGSQLALEWRKVRSGTYRSGARNQRGGLGEEETAGFALWTSSVDTAVLRECQYVRHRRNDRSGTAGTSAWSGQRDVGRSTPERTRPRRDRELARRGARPQAAGDPRSEPGRAAAHAVG